MIWAAIDILNSECVQLMGGDPTTARFNRDPMEAALHWASEGAGGLHIVDLDKALGQGSNTEIIEKILSDSPIPTQIGGGIRSTEEIEGWLNLGAIRVIVGTKAIQNRKWLEEITNAFPGRIVLALDTKQGVVTTDGWTQSSDRDLLDFVNEIEHLSLASLLHTNIDIEGSESGINKAAIKALCNATATPVLISGGIASEADIKLALSLGADGVVIGTALYSGKIELSKLMGEQAHAER